MLKKIITCSLILFLVLSTITPSFATTESTQNESEEEYQLYRLLEEVSIDDLFVLPKDTLIFAQEEEGIYSLKLMVTPSVLMQMR